MNWEGGVPLPSTKKRQLEKSRSTGWNTFILAECTQRIELQGEAILFNADNLKAVNLLLIPAGRDGQKHKEEQQCNISSLPRKHMA